MLASPLYRFAAFVIAGAPDDPGVYALWDRDELIYIGRAGGDQTTIQCMLMAHFHGRIEPVSATHYSWELARDPVAREVELLRKYQAQHKRLPRANGAA